MLVGSVAKRAQTAPFFDEDGRLAARISPKESLNQSTINYNSIFKHAYWLLKQWLRLKLVYTQHERGKRREHEGSVYGR